MNALTEAVSALQDLRVLVIGLGKTGHSVCSFLSAHAVAFDAVDECASAPLAADVAGLPLVGEIHAAINAKLLCTYDLLIVSPGVPLATPAIKAASDSGAEIIGDIELFTRCVTQPIIAVTGSNGKSTVVAWLDAVLQHTSFNAVLCGNIGEPALTMIDAAADLYILELSSFQLETTHSLAALSATVLNISADHMDRYNSLDTYAAAKRRIYNACSFCVVNAEDTRTQPYALYRNFGTLLQFTDAAPEGDAYGVQHVDGVAWLASSDQRVIERDRLPLPGPHNVLNALAVLALLHPLDVPVEQLAAGLLAFQGLPHRTELVAEYKGVRWYNDSKGTNVDASSRAVAAMDGPVILILGGMGKAADFTLLRGVVQAHVRELILIGRDAPLIAEALACAANQRHATDMADAVQQSAALARRGDVVLLSPACSSFDMFDNFEHRGEVFTRAAQKVAA